MRAKAARIRYSAYLVFAHVPTPDIRGVGKRAYAGQANAREAAPFKALSGAYQREASDKAEPPKGRLGGRRSAHGVGSRGRVSGSPEQPEGMRAASAPARGQRPEMAKQMLGWMAEQMANSPSG